MKTFFKKHFWLEIFAILFAVHAFVACGKSSGGGPAVYNPGLAGISNNCGPFGCFGASAGQQISRAQGTITHDDELDSMSEKAQNRLMELALNINMWQPTGGMNTFGAGYPMGLPMQGNLNINTYNGPVHISGQVQVLAPILGCNIPQGNYMVQPQGSGMLTLGTLTVALGINVNGGQGFTIMVEGLNVIPGNFVTGGINIGQQQPGIGYADSRLYGLIRIPNCDNATFKVE